VNELQQGDVLMHVREVAGVERVFVLHFPANSISRGSASFDWFRGL
jgi:hypothetical protein